MNEITKFLIVGGITTCFNYGVFYILLIIGINYIISSSIGYVSGILIGYFANRAWAFNYQLGHSIKLITNYLMLYISTLLINIFLLWYMVEFIDINVLIANIIAIAISTLLNFLGLKFIVFK